ncbi:MAG: murein biosynthesis integral membrane protein MurJ [Verrucomicrobiota bacterium]
MLKSSGAMGIATLASRILGMVREMVYASFMGDTPVAGAFKLAFKIPNLFRRLLGEGALTAAFIPIFKDKEKNAGEAEMWRASNAVISGLLASSALFIGLVMLVIAVVLAAGEFSDNTRLMLQLLGIMFPYLLLVCLAAVLIAMLNSRGLFFIPAMGGTMLNVVMIASVLWLAPRLGETLDKQIFGLAIGVLVAGVAQAAFQLPSLWRQGFRFRWVSPWSNDTVREVVARMVPGTIGVAAFQINVLVTDGVAFLVDPQIIASLDYAVRLMEFPQGVFGVSLATFLLPTLSGLAAEKNFTEFRAMLGKGLDHLVFVNLPVSIMLAVLAEPIVRLLFERGQFDADATRRAAVALTCLGPGLVAFSMTNVLTRAFFALGDTTTPMRISLVCLGVNLAVGLAFVIPFRQAGLAMANTLSAIINTWLLITALRRKLGTLDFALLLKNLVATVSGSIVAGVVAWWLADYWLTHFGHRDLGARLGAVFVPLLAAAAAYWTISLTLRVNSAREILETALERVRPKQNKA